MSDLAERSFERILIIKPSSAGDILHALPVLRAVRGRFPSAHIAWLVAASFADLLSAEPELNEVIPFERHRFARLGRSAAVTRDFLAFVGAMRSRRYDLAIDLQGLFRSAFLARASGAPTRVGFAEAREFAPLFYTHRVRGGDAEMHAADRNRLVAVALGCDDSSTDVCLTLREADRAAAAALLEGAGARAADGCAVLAPATRWETKCWPAERYGRLARLIRERAGLSSVLVGGRADEAAGRAAEAASDGAAVNLCGRTTLRTLAAVVAGARVVVSGDSTPMHLAAAFGRPLVALFGPTNPRRTGPYGRDADVLRVDLDCSPCYLRRRAQCPYEHACMERLTVESVAEVAVARVGRRAARLVPHAEPRP